MSKEQGRGLRFRPFQFITRRVRNKLLLAFLGAGTGALIIAFTSLVAMNIGQKTVAEVVGVSGRVVALAHMINEEISIAYKYEQRFFLNYRSIGFSNAQTEYLSPYENRLEGTSYLIGEIEDLAYGNDFIVDVAEDVLRKISFYHYTFKEIVDLYRKRGEGKEGRVGDVNRSYEKIATKLSSLNQELLDFSLLDLDSKIRQYILSEDIFLADSVYDKADILERRINGSNLSVDDKKELLKFLSYYLMNFNDLVDVDRRIDDLRVKLNSATNRIFPLLENIIDAANHAQEQSVTDMKKSNQYASILVFIVAVLTVFVGIFTAFFLSGRLTRQINSIMDVFGNIGIGDFQSRVEVTSEDELGEMAESLNAMLDNTLNLIQSRDERDAIQESIMKLLMEISDLAEGDLTGRAEVTEEITGALADSFNNMAEHLSQVVLRVKETSELVRDSSTEIEGVTAQLVHLTEAQEDKLDGAVKIIAEVAVDIKRVAKRAKLSADVSDSAKSTAQEGAIAVQQTSLAMASIKENMRDTARAIKRLGESSQEIGEIVKIINDITDRTSILALNASIQASLAGEAGRGFAVVAEEVQRLAERSAESTKKIELLVGTIQGDIGEAGVSMETSLGYVVDGTELAVKAHEKLGEIETISNQLDELIGQISESTVKQTKDSERATLAMEEVGKLTDAVSKETDEAARSTMKISKASNELDSSIAAFKVSDS